jgi:HD superfamily phosphodiesterase
VWHFVEKLFLLCVLMQSRAGRALAKRRQRAMAAFITQFLDEWQCDS